MHQFYMNKKRKILETEIYILKENIKWSKKFGVSQDEISKANQLLSSYYAQLFSLLQDDEHNDYADGI